MAFGCFGGDVGRSIGRATAPAYFFISRSCRMKIRNNQTTDQIFCNQVKHLHDEIEPAPSSFFFRRIYTPAPSSSSSSRRTFTPINLHNTPPCIEDNARAAFNFHNQKQNPQLEFVRILNGCYESIEGTMLHLMIEVNNVGKSTNYRVEVNCQPWSENTEEHTEDAFREYVRARIRSHTKLLRRALFKKTKQSHTTEAFSLQEFDPEYMVRVEDSARLAVNLHNQKENAELQFVRIVKADCEFVAGYLLHVTIEVNNAGRLSLYRTVIYNMPCGGHMEIRGPLTLVDDDIGG